MSDVDNGVYYKIYYNIREDYVTVVTMQWFDEDDYNNAHFFKDEDGVILKFDNEDTAIQWLNDNVKEDKINPEYRKKGFNQKRFMKN